MPAAATKRTAIATRIAGKLKSQLAASKTRASQGRKNAAFGDSGYKVVFAGTALATKFSSKAAAQKVADSLSKSMPGGPAAVVVRSNSGGAFKRCVKSVAKKGKATSPRAVCAAIGRKKYGKKKFQQMATAGRRAKKNATDFSLYDAAKKADDAFQAALVKQYGARAGDMRYRPAKHPAHIKALAKAKHAADDRWLKEMGRKNPKLLTSIGQGKVRADVYALKDGTHQVRTRGDKPKEFESAKAAMSFARLRVHELARNPSPLDLMYAESMLSGKDSITGKVLKRLQGKKANPEGAAEEMYQVFHGIAPANVIEYRQVEHVHEWLWAVGTLNNMHVSNGKKTITLTAPDPEDSPFEDVVMVCMTEDGKQMEFRGGDQSLPLDGIGEAFGLTEDDLRDRMEIGRITQLTYRTAKIFEDGGKTNVDFYHDLGKEHAHNKLPMLVYRPLNPSMELVGGRYLVAALDKSIKASPGIVG